MSIVYQMLSISVFRESYCWSAIDNVSVLLGWLFICWNISITFQISTGGRWDHTFL